MRQSIRIASRLAAVRSSAGAAAQTAAHLAAGGGQILSRQSQPCAPGRSQYQESKAAEITAYLRPNPNFTFERRPAPALQRQPVSAVQLRVAAGYRSTICTSGSTSANCACESAQEGTAIARIAAAGPGAHPAVQPAQRLRPDAAGEAAAGAGAGRTWTTSTRNWHQPRPLPVPATSRAWIWTASCCSGCNTNRDYQTALVNAADRENHAAPAAQRPHAGGPVRRHGALRFPGAAAAAGRFPHHCAGRAARICRRPLQAVDKAEHGSQTGGGQRFHRSHFRHGFRAQSADSALHRSERQHSAADFRPQSGREGAHPDRYRACRAAEGCGPGAGVQRRGFGLLHAGELGQPAQALQGRDGYLETATRVRDTMSFSYQRGQAALVDYLDAQRDYRATEVAYINLVGAYLTAAGQLNLAVGREVLQ